MESPAVKTEKDWLACCGSSRFAQDMVAAGPFSSCADAVDAARDIWFNNVDVNGRLEAFAAHPAIGERPPKTVKSPASAQWSKGEQATALATATDDTLQELYEWNARYRKKFGFVFLICASGRRTPEILAEIKKQYYNRPIVEFELAAKEQMKITELRIAKLFSASAIADSTNNSADVVTKAGEDRMSVIGGHLTTASEPPKAPTRTRPPITTHILDVAKGLQQLQMAATGGETDQVLVERKSCGRIFTLNRPKQLNALSGVMITRLLELLLACAEDSSVRFIIIKGKGRAFCAGGDVAAVVRNLNQGNRKSGAHYFRKEYIMNYVIATYNKPQVSILNGIVMGGGAGVSLYMVDSALPRKKRDIQTFIQLFAMPETALGLFPDIGASYFLSRLPGFFGEYVGLTGARLDGAEMLTVVLQRTLFSQRLPLLEAALVKANASDPMVISTIIGDFSHAPNLKNNSAYHRLDIINKCFSRRTVEDIISALETESANKNDDWISSTIQSLKKASPTSLKISLRSIREGRLEGIGKCLIREYRMVCHVMLGEVSKDFIEGCRAILVDKDRNPKWEPSKLELVSDEMVDRYFSKVDDDDEWEDLELPVSSKLPAYVIAKL